MQEAIRWGYIENGRLLKWMCAYPDSCHCPKGCKLPQCIMPTRIEKIQSDLKYSVIKTRELRAELAERATENVHAEAKIREVETELSVAHASTDMIATGILDYRLAQDEEDEEQQSADEDEATRVSQSTH